MWRFFHEAGVLGKNRLFSFHVKELAKHSLNNSNSLKAIQQAVKNIFNSGVDEQLQMLCKAYSLQTKQSAPTSIR